MLIRPLLLAARVWDDWDESKHPRKSNGQFGAGGAGGAVPKSPLRRAAEVVKPKRKSRKSRKITAAERERVTHEISTWFYGRFDGKSKGYIAVRNHIYFFTINEYGDYDIYAKVPLK